MQPGVYIAHGQVVIDGFVEIEPGVVIFPWVTIGLRAGNFDGPKILDGVHIGTGSKVIGPVTIGKGARIGANVDARATGLRNAQREAQATEAHGAQPLAVDAQRDPGRDAVGR